MKAVFIDGENTKGRIRDVFVKFDKEFPAWESYDFSGLFNETLGLTEPTERRFYRAQPVPHPDLKEYSEELLVSYRNLGGHGM